MSSFVGIWHGLHQQIALLSGNPELAITEADAREWLFRAQNVMRHYPLSASQSAIDWAAFAFVTSFLYIPRGAAIMARRRAEAAQGGMPAAGATAFHFAQPHKANGAAKPESSDFASPPPMPPVVDGVVDEPEL